MRRRGRLEIWLWAAAAAAWAWTLFGGVSPAEAGDCSAPSDCRYVPDNGNATLPVAAGGTAVLATRLRRRRGKTEPIYKPPAEYTDPATGGRRDNPFDPSVDEQRDRWIKDHLVWDPQTLSWRPPNPDEVPPPPDAPESTPFQRTNPRDGTPPECLSLYDDYVQAEANVLQLEQDVQDAANRLQQAQLYLNQNLVKLTLQLQMDTADIFMAGASGVKAGMGIATAVASAGAAIAELLRAAMTKAKYLEEVVARLIESAGQLAARLARIESSTSTLSASMETAAAEAGEAEEAVGAAEQRVSVAERRVNLSNQVDELVAQRDAVVQEATDAENKLGVGENYWERKKGLQEWADSEKAAAAEQNNRAFAKVQGDLSDAEAQLDNLRVKDPEAAQAADQAVQAKLGEAGDVKKELDELKQMQYRRDWAKQAREDAVAHLDDEQAQVSAISDEREAKIAEREQPLREQLDAASQDRKQIELQRDQIESELAAVDQQLEAPLPDEMTPEQSARRQALIDAKAAAEQEMSSAEAARDAYNSAHVRDRAPLPDDIRNRFVAAQQRLETATDELAALEHQLGMNAQRSGMRQTLMQRQQQLRAARQQVKIDLQAAEAKNADIRSQIGAAQKSVYDETSERWDRAVADRDSAQRDLDQAESQLAKSEQEVQQADPASKIPGLQDQYQQLVAEYDDLRARAEKLKSGTYTDDAKAAELQKRIGQLQQQLRDWKDPDWEDYAAQHDADKYQQWKLEVEGTDPAADQSNDLGDLRQKVADLKQREDQLERQIADLRDQMQPDVTMDSPQTALANAEDDLAAKEQAAAAKKQAADQAKNQLDAAQTELASVRAERDAQQQQLQQAQTDLDNANAEVDRLRSQQDAGGDMMQAPQGVVDSAQGVVQDAAAAAAAAKQYIVDKLKAGVGKVGKAWEWAFNGQSPDEIATILKNQHDNVQQRSDELTAAQQALDQARQTMKDTKPQLDACIASHVDTA